MRKMLFAALVTCMFALVVAPVRAALASDDEPEPLLCTFELTFDTDHPELGWVGTVSGDLEGTLQLNEHFADIFVVGATEHFFEDSVIATENGNITGVDKGVWNFGTYKFRATGWVTGATTDEMAYLVGYKMNMMGVTSAFPPTPPDTLVTAMGRIMLAPA